MKPYKKSLGNRLVCKPVELTCINSNQDEQQLKKDLKENQVTWRSFQNQRKAGTQIATEWGVRGWPTLYLIDHRGSSTRNGWAVPRTKSWTRKWKNWC